MKSGILMKNGIVLVAMALALTSCQTFGAAKPQPIAVTPPIAPTSPVAISGGGLVGGNFGSALTAKDRQLALNAEYKALEYGKSNEAVDWSGEGGLVVGKVKAAQPYRVGSQDCRQYAHELVSNGVTKAARGTACRNSDGSWSLLE
jgi:surface antigen